MILTYILEDKIPVPCQDILRWAEWMENADRVVKKNEIKHVYISTVFLGVNPHFMSKNPKLFETMIFGGTYNMQSRQYETWEEAEKGHEELVVKVLTSGSNTIG